ncbi:hypothetical protein HRH25_09365 [Flavisolibacter sp. BT320]|nr:hypothetical protein [Flavisolibacter longurius]
MIPKNFVALFALTLSLFFLSCSKSSTVEEIVKPPAGSSVFSLTVGNTTYNLDSLQVIETSLGYYIRATEKENPNDAYGISLFLNTKTPGATIGYGNFSETGKAYVSGSLGAGQQFSSSHLNTGTGNVTTSNGRINASVANGVLTASFTGSLFTATGEAISVALSLKTSLPTETPDNPSLQFFDFEFDGATYSLHALAATPHDKGYLIMGLASNNQIVTLVMNTKAVNTSVAFGDVDDAGTSSAMFNIPSDQVYATTGRDCGGRSIVYNQGAAKFSAIGPVGGYIEGTISGAAYKNENACNGDGKTIESKPFRGFFKIKRIL